MYPYSSDVKRVLSLYRLKLFYGRLIYPLKKKKKMGFSILLMYLGNLKIIIMDNCIFFFKWNLI